MPTCTFCGAELPADAQFCGSCGRLVRISSGNLPSQQPGQYQQDSFVDVQDFTSISAHPSGPSYFSSSPSWPLSTSQPLDQQPTRQAPPTPPPAFLPPSDRGYGTVMMPQPASYGAAFTGQPGEQLVEKDEDDDERGGFLFFPASISNAPMIQGTPHLSNAPMIQGTPQLGSTPSQPTLRPSNALGSVSSPEQSIWQHSPPAGMHPPQDVYPPAAPQTPPTWAPQPRPKPAPKPIGCITWLMIVVIFLFIIGGLLSTLFFVSPSLSVTSDSGDRSSTVSRGSRLHIHGSWYTPGSHITLSLDGSLQLTETQHTIVPATASNASRLTAQHSTASTSTAIVPTLHSLQAASSPTTIIVAANGVFDTSIIVGQDWSVGKHTIRATEQITDRGAHVDITVGAFADIDHITPNTLALGPITEGDTQPITAQVALSTIGIDLVQWQASWDQNKAPWLQLDHTFDSIQAPHSEQVVIHALTQGLKAGNYNTNVTFTNTKTNKHIPLAISLTVQPNTIGTALLASISPDTVTLDTATEGSTQSVSQTVTLTTSGKGHVEWKASWDQKKAPWLNLDQLDASINAPDTQQVTVRGNPQGVDVGSYTAFVTFTSPQSTQPLRLTVNFTIQAPPPGVADIASITPNPVTLGSVTEGYTQITSQQISLNTSGSGNVPWKASWDAGKAPWLQLSKTSDTIAAPAAEKVNVGASLGLKAGDYKVAVTFTNTQTNTKIILTVSLKVQAQPLTFCGIDPSAITLSATQGYQQVSPASATLCASGSGQLTWSAVVDKKSATADGTWVVLSATSGQITAPGTQSITVSAATGLTANTYTATIIFTDKQSGKQLTTLPVTFTVQPAPMLSVSPTSINTYSCETDTTYYICAVTLSNESSSSSLTWSSTTGSNGSFASADTKTIDAGAKQSVTIYVPLKVSSDTVTFNGPGNSVTVTLTYTTIIR